jgi:hypothetical protein
VTPEGRVKVAVRKVLNKHGIWYFMPVAGGFGVHGIPDFICCMGGRFLAIETKAPGKIGDTTANQKRVLKEIQMHEGLVLVVDDAQQLEHFLEITP